MSGTKGCGHERLFPHFSDAIDGVICVPADIRPAELRGHTAPLGLRFPLLLDDEAVLAAQVDASTHAPASARFGRFCDNVTGMNWRLPSGELVRVGEQVVKSTTGYDLLRFLLGTAGRVGTPVDYVLRLRPACDGGGILTLRGDPRRQRRAAASVIRSPFAHWLDRVEWWVGGPEPEPVLRLGVHCMAGEWGAFADWAADLAGVDGLVLDAAPGDAGDLPGLPDCVLKTTPDRAIDLAGEVAARDDAACVVIVPCGVVLVRLRGATAPADAVARLVAPLAPGLHALGGDWQSRHVVPPPTCPDEERWLARLLSVWESAA